MRKHFLILMLLALLPLAGFAAQNLVFKIGATPVTNKKYTGSALGVSVYKAGGVDDATVTSIKYMNVTTEPADWTGAEDFGNNAAEMKNAGFYLVTDDQENTGVFQIKKVDLMIQPINVEKVYGSSDADLATTIGATGHYYGQGFVGDDDRASIVITGLVINRPQTTTSELVDTYSYTLSVNNASTQNYNLMTNSTAELSIVKKQITIVADEYSKTYNGTALADKVVSEAIVPLSYKLYLTDDLLTEKSWNDILASWDLTNDEPKAGLFSISLDGAIANSKNVATYDDAIVPAWTDNDNYEVTITPADFVINPKAITAPAFGDGPFEITYGEAAPNWGITFTEGDLVLAEDANDFEVIESGQTVLPTAAKATAYTVVISDVNGNYNYVSPTAEYTINFKAINAQGVAIQPIAAKTYTSNVIELTTADTPATYYTLAEATEWNTTHADEIAADATLEKHEGDVKEALIPAELIVMDGDTRLVYGTDYNVAYENHTNAGENAATVTITGAGNYATDASNTLEATFTINKAPLTVKLATTNQAINYGVDPDLTLAYDGALGGQVAETLIGANVPVVKIDGAVYNPGVTAKLAPGSHAVTFDVTDATVLDNYAYVLAEDNTVEVGKAQLTVTLANAEVTWNGTATADNITTALANAYTLSVAVPAEAFAASPVVTSTAAATANYLPAVYALEFSGSAQLTPEYAAKYNLVLAATPANLTINKKAGLKITALNQTVEKVDDASDSDFNDAVELGVTYSISGFATGEDAENLSVDLSGLTITTDDAKLTTAGEYVGGIVIDGATSDYYELTHKNGDLTVAGAGMILTLAQNSDAAAKIQTANGNEMTTVKVTVNRNQTIGSDTYTWDAQEFNALVLPFNVTVTELSEQFGYAVVNVVKPSSTTPGKIYFALEWGTIPANTPFVVRTRDNVENKTLTFANKEIVWSANPFALAGPANVDAANQYKFVGTYSTYTITGASHGNQRFFGDNTDHGVGTNNPSTTATWDIVPFDAYLDYQSYFGTVGAHDVTLVFEDLNGGTTSINAAEFSRKAVSAEGWYTLNGVKLQGVPTEKGVYIQNGKKVVIK